MSKSNSAIGIRKLFFFYILPFIGWLGLIHFSSSQAYEDQNVQPLIQGVNLDWVHDWFSWVSFYYGDTLVSLETRSPEAFLEFFVRKGAHLFVFAVLGILAYRLIKQFLHNPYYAAMAAWFFVVIYASVDEYRQFLHPDRSGMLADVILDAIGGLVGIIIYLIGDRRSAGQ